MEMLFAFGFGVALLLLVGAGAGGSATGAPDPGPVGEGNAALFERVSGWAYRLYPRTGLRREGDPIVDAVLAEVSALATNTAASHDARRRAEVVAMLLEHGDIAGAVDKLTAWSATLQK